MKSRPEQVDFNERDPAEVVRHMDALRERGRGWINFLPDLGDDEVPEGSIAMCTWVVGQQRRDRVEPDTIGIQHRTGGKAAARLRERGITLPEGWRVMQDHRRRGLVVAIAAGSETAGTLEWLLRAGTLLTDPGFAGGWHTEIYAGR